MASKSTASQALDAYRREILSDSVETRIAQLSEVVATYEASCRDRERQAKQLLTRTWWSDAASLRETFEQMEQLAQRQWSTEDAVLTAFEAAKAAGAKPSVLASIGLRPDAALAAARTRGSLTAPPVSPPTAPSAESDETASPAAEPVAAGQHE